MELLKIKLIASCLFIAGISNAQMSTTTDFNYYDINKSEFTVDASCFGLSATEQEEYEYRFTSIHLANELEALFNNATDSLDQVVGGYRLLKRRFLNQSLGGEDFRYIMLRPDDNVIRPVVMITTGGKTGGPSPLRMLSLGVYDYVQRGYAVAFYQSGTASGDNVQALTEAGFTAPCQYNWSPDETMDCFQQAVYVKYQFAVAARDYTTMNSANLMVDENMIFATGFSGGSVGTLYLALTDPGNFNDPIFVGMGNFNNLSRFPNESGEIQAVATLAGAIIDQNSSDYKVGDLLDVSDQSTRFLMLHGQDDFAVQPETNPLQWSDPNYELPGSQMAGTISLDEMLKSNGIESKAVINCSACHNLYTWPCDYNDDCLGNNPIFGFDCALWALPTNYNSLDFSNLCAGSNDQSNWTEIFYVMDQIHDYGKIIAKFFHEDFADSGSPRVPDAFIDEIYANDEVYALNPVDFPFDAAAGATNGHYEQSDKCLVQTCSALYFNEAGNANLLGTNYQGDYLTVVGLPQSTFNNNFTLEMQVKAIDQDGIATLFSQIDNFTFGFELLITGNGYVQFKKNAAGGQGAITGNVDILDDVCHILSVTRDGNEFGLYVDGILQENKKSYNINFSSAIASRIGNTLNEAVINKAFNGIIRNVVLWDAAIPTSGLGQISIPTSTTNLVAEWQLNQGFGQTFLSTNNAYPIHLGTNENSAEFDPRWMKNDEICYCMGDTVVGVEEMEILAEKQLVLYPNPNNGSFTIEFDTEQSLPKLVSFYSIEGSLVQQMNVEGVTLKLNDFRKGMYLVLFQYEDQVVTKKVIVQ